jgi:FtsP/CotA-like multicopper oxidase with cupredoxin domain
MRLAGFPVRLGRFAVRLAVFAMALGPWSTSASAQQAAGPSGSGDGPTWRMPPTSANMQMLMAPFMGILPDVSPFLPGANVDVGTLPEARVGGVVRLTDGDTLRLEATLLRREIAGQTVKVYGFNGQSPGPTIRVPQDATIIVEFTNRIDFPTTLRWHGVRVDNQFDGVPGQTQPPVRVGDTYTAEVYFPDAGAFWYHPHQRGHIAQELGLYGAIIVDSPDLDYYSPVNLEETLLLDDVLIDDLGILPFGFEAPVQALMGRFGNVHLINGQDDFRRTVNRGDVVRLYLTDASNTRPYNLRVEGGMRMKLVGGDLGRFEREEWVSSVIIAPGQRYIVEVLFEDEGEFALTNRITAVDHFLGEFEYQVDTLGIFDVSSRPTEIDFSAAFETLRTYDGGFDEIRAQAARPVDEELVLALRIGALPLPVIRMLEIDTLYYPPVEFNDAMPMMNWLSTGVNVLWLLHEPSPGVDPRDLGPATGWRFRQGDLVKIRLFNDPDSWHPMSHPLHLHGQRFVVVERDGVPSTNLVWSDTVFVPVGSTVDLMVEMSNPGRWMFNCQIPEHLGAGMSMSFLVLPSGA